MSRNGFFRVLCTLGIIIIGFAMFAPAAHAQSQTLRRTLPIQRAPAPMPSLLPLAATPAGPGPRVALSGRKFVRTNLRRPSNAPSLERALRATKGRRPQSATGATVYLIGDHNAYTAGNAQISDYTLGWGEQVGFDCANLTPNETNLNWILFPPDGSAFINYSTTSTDAFGNCAAPIQDITLSTPYGTGTDTPYAGVWAAALRKSNGDYESVTYFVVSGEPKIATYSDGALSLATRDFVSGQTMYVVANGLNPSDKYAIGWVQASVSPLKCVHAVPATFAALPNCFSTSVANAGVTATSGQFEATWDTSAAPVPAGGNYAIQLYDVTQHHLIATQQVALQSAGINWTLTPYAGSTNGSTGLSDFKYAFDGLLDQSVTGLTYAVSGLGAISAARLTVSDPNGAVLTSTLSSDGKHPAAPASVAVGGGSATSGQTPFALNTTKITSVGPTALPNASQTLLAQLYDPIGQTVIAAKTFTLLAYGATFNWNAGGAVNAAPGGSCMVVDKHTLTVTNTADNLYGSGSGDGIVGVKIAPDAGGNESMCGGDATATDSNGNTWTIAYAGGIATATINAAKPAALPVGGTLSFGIIMGGASSACGGPPCTLQTQILPLHGINYSAPNSVTSGLLVGGKNGTTPPSDYSWAVTGASPGNGVNGTPPFSQMLYVSGTDTDTSASNYYTVTATIQNNNPTGNANTINDILFTFPASYDFTIAANKPTLVSLKNGATPITGWSVATKQSGTNNVPSANSFAITNGTSNATPTTPIQPSTTVVATFKIPMPPVSFALQQIAATGNFDGGCLQNTGAHCTYTSTPLIFASTQNSVAGTTNVDSTELGVYSLDTAKMSGVFNPQTIGAGVASSSTFTFTNTPTSADPNPDYVDAITLTFPAGTPVASITPPSGWTVTGTNPYTVTLNACTPTPCQETGAIAPGGTLPLTVTFTAATVAGTYDGVGADPAPVYWYVRGANGGTSTLTTTAAEGKSTLIVSPVSASVSFAGAGGYPTAAAVPTNSEPTVGSDADATNGNAFDYKITNNGSKPITDATITIPALNRAGSSGVDSGGQNWQIVGSAVAAGCGSAVVTQISGSTNGSIVLSGCAIAPGNAVDVKFNAKAPYQIGSEFDWPATVCDNTGSGCAGINVGATPSWSTAEFVKIVVDGRLSIIYSNGTPVVGAVPSLPNPGPGGSGAGGSAPVTTCAGCGIAATGAAPILSLGTFNGVFTSNDLLDVAITSNAVSPNQWNLYVSIDANPLNGSSAKEFSMKIDTAHMNALSGYTVPAAATSLFQPPATGTGVYPTAGTGSLIGTFSGSAHRLPIDNIQSFQVNNTGAAAGIQSVTLMYTLIIS